MGKFTKAISLIVLFFILSGLFFYGCKDTKIFKGKTVLRAAYWGDIKEVEIITNSVKRFKQKNPGIEVQLEKLPAGDAYIEKMLTQIAGGNPPDVMFVNAERFIVFAEKGVLMSLNDFIKKENFPLNKFYKKIVDKFTVNGNVYALPRDIAPVCVVYYNKDLFDKAGVKYPTNDWTWNDLLNKAKKLTKGEGTTKIFGFADDWPIWDAWVLSNGGKYVDDIKNPKKCLLDSKEALEALKFRQNMIYKYKVMPSPSNMAAMGGVGSSDLFVQGKVAMFHSGIWKSPFFREIKNFRWDAVMFPKGPKGKRGFPLSGAGYAVLKTTKYPEAAWKLVTFFSGEEGQIELAQTGLAQPAIVEIAKSKNFLDDNPPKSKEFLLEAVDYGTFQPDTSAWTEILNRHFWPAMDKVWNGTSKPEEVIPDAVKKINNEFFVKK